MPQETSHDVGAFHFGQEQAVFREKAAALAKDGSEKMASCIKNWKVDLFLHEHLDQCWSSFPMSHRSIHYFWASK